MVSFVSIVAGESWVSVMSDGRVTKDGQPTDEARVKFREVVPRRVFVAHAGSLPWTQCALDLAAQELAQGTDFTIVAVDMQRFLREVPAEHPVLVAFGGLDSSGNVHVYAMSNLGAYMELSPNSAEPIRYAFLYNSNHVVDDHKLSEILQQLYQRHQPIGQEDWKLVQNELNDYVARLDPTVNTTTYHLWLSK